MVGIHHGWLWFPKNPGLVSGIVIAGFGFGPFILGFVATDIINPWGDPIDKDTLLYPDRVNDRFHLLIKSLAAIYAGVGLLAVALVFKGPVPDTKSNKASQFA